MVLRLFLALGVVLLGATGYFIVIQTPPTVQAVPAEGEYARLAADGILPTGSLRENEEVEHGIFAIPPEDEAMLDKAMDAMGDMPGMNMDGMEMSGGTGGMAGMDMSGGGSAAGGSGGMDMAGAGGAMDMDMDGDGVPDMRSADMGADMSGGGTATTGTGMAGMDMSEGGAAQNGAGAMDMDMDGDGVPDMRSADMGADMSGGGTATTGTGMAGMDMSEGGATQNGAGAMDMDMDGDGVPDTRSADMGGMEMGASGQEATAETGAHPEDEAVAERMLAQQMAGLVVEHHEVPIDREITLSMSEWTFSNLNVEVKEGERIKFTVRNDGKVLHEFMFMGMAQMQAVAYRAKRADWNLLEHEALFEKSLLLPGQELTFIATVTKPGAWMFMCMLPYHMQMGMMGQLATPGMAMQM